MALANQLLSYRLQQVRPATAAVTKNEDVDGEGVWKSAVAKTVSTGGCDFTWPLDTKNNRRCIKIYMGATGSRIC